MIENVLAYLRNFFVVKSAASEWEIKGGAIDVPFLIDGQYFRIMGSVLNDGVYRYPAEGLKNETFYGTVYGLAIPKALLDLISEIEEWQSANGKAAAAPYQSESFGGYSYTLKGDAETAASWQTAFAARLNAWRKI